MTEPRGRLREGLRGCIHRFPSRPLGIGLLLAGLWWPPGRAHELLTPRADHLVVAPSGVRLEQRYDLTTGTFAGELRLRHDRDRNGRLDEQEQQGLIDWLELATTHFVRLEVNGLPVALEPKARRAGPLEPKLPSERGISSTFRLESAAIPWGNGVTRVRFVDRFKDSSIPLGLSLHVEQGCVLERGVLIRGAKTQEQGGGGEAAGVVPAQTRALPSPLPGQPALWQGLLIGADEALELELRCEFRQD